MHPKSNKAKREIEFALYFFDMFGQFDDDMRNEHIKYIIINDKKYKRKTDPIGIRVEWTKLMSRLKNEDGYIGKEDCVFRKINLDTNTVEYYLKNSVSN